MATHLLFFEQASSLALLEVLDLLCFSDMGVESLHPLRRMQKESEENPTEY